MTFPIHPLAELFPAMLDADLRALAEDIKQNGQHESIVLLDGQVLDGRNRLRACEIAGVNPLVTSVSYDNPVAFVLSRNLHRRHLTESQRALVAARLVTLKPGEKQTGHVAALTQDAAADLLHVGARSVRRARAFLDADPAPELVAAVERGEVAIASAATVAAKRPAAKQAEYVQKGTVRDAAARIRRDERKAALATAGVVSMTFDEELAASIKHLRATLGYSAAVPRTWGSSDEEKAQLARAIIVELRRRADEIEHDLAGSVEATPTSSTEAAQ